MTIRILHNANIYTLDPENPTASALVVERSHGDGRILAIGHDDDILSEFVGIGVRHNLDGKTIIPGLIDAHIHLKQYAQNLAKINCEVPTMQECLDRVAERARSSPRGEWILGHGWNQNDWARGFGTAADLDQVAPNHPVHLTSKSLHAAWVNSAALKIAGIHSTSPDPANGIIQRDTNGVPTGILLEYASELVENLIPEPAISDLIASVDRAQTNLIKLGITSIHDFDQQDCFSALQHLNGESKLVLRVIKSIPLDSLHHAIELGLQSGFGDDRLRIGSVKLFSDGALGPHTAAMVEPYQDSPNNYGNLFMDAEEIYEHGHNAVINSLSLAVHAIGDLANREVLNAFERLRAEDTQLRHRIEHVQILQPADAHRLAKLGIIASMQPIHATSDMEMANRLWGGRASYSYALKTLLSQGTRMAFGSDAPVESPNPFWGIHAAVTRQRADGSPGLDGWYPKERLTILEALRGFTTGAAYAGGMDDRQGKLIPGYLADLLVLDSDILKCDPAELRNIHPFVTMIGGEWFPDSP